MKITNAIKIAMANKFLCCKTLLYKAVIVFLCVLSLSLFASIVINPILNSEEVSNILDTMRQIVKDFLLMNPKTDGSAYSEALKSSFNVLLDFIKNMTGEIFWVSLAMVVIVYLTVFLLGLADYSIGVNVNEHMTSILHAGFFGTLFDNFKKASIYSLYRTLLLFVYNSIVFSVVAVVVIYTSKWFGLYTITVIFFIFFVSNALRYAFTGLVLPKMVCENKGVITAFKESIKPSEFSQFASRFLSYLLMSITAYVISCLSSLITFNVALIVVIPLSSVAFTSLRFIDYYAINQKKYYVTYDEIVVPKQLRENDEHLLNKVDID